MASQITESIGGKENIVKIDNCATRLRLILKDNSNIDEAKIKASGTFGIKKLGSESLQIVVGVEVEHVADAMKRQLNMQ